jgi:hypothetical protein
MDNSPIRERARIWLELINEYLLIIAPIAFYVMAEIAAHQPISYFLCSPEWAIATIFLFFQSARLYSLGLLVNGKNMAPFISICWLLAFVFSFLAALNVFMSVHENTMTLVTIRLALLIFATLIFVVIGGAGLKARADFEGDTTRTNSQ